MPRSEARENCKKRKWRSFKGTKREAQVECARLISEMKGGLYVDPSKLSVSDWIDQWIEAGAPGRRRKKPGQRTLERYGQLLRTHIKPALGGRQLQKLRAAEIDKLYADIEAAGKIAPRTAHHVHVVLGACLATAHRKGLIAANSMVRKHLRLVAGVPDGANADLSLVRLPAGALMFPALFGPRRFRQDAVP